MANLTKNSSLLLPFSFLYKLGVGLRNKLFDWKILSSEEFSIPIISIGNITVGGTGKTPHTEYLVQLLSKTAKVAVLSRGYKRKTKGFILADNSSNSHTIGDEPFQIHKKFPDILVAVDGNRRRGIRKLLSLDNNRKPDIILLDDAFQHRYVIPSLSILLTDSNNIIYEDWLLPVGRLREPASNKSRANIVIVTKCSENLNPIDYRIITKNLKLYPYQSLYFTSFFYGNPVPVFDCEARSLSIDDIKVENYSVLVLTGIASPEGLIQKIKSYTDKVETLAFPDHHHFSYKDIGKIIALLDKMPGNNKVIITTEKDAIRLIDCNSVISDFHKKYIYYLPINVFFNWGQEKIFNQKIEEHVRNIKRNRILA